MKRRQLTKNWALHEFIPKEVYAKYDKAKRLYLLDNMLDFRIVDAAQKLTDHFGSAECNTWWWDGDRFWSGIRLPDRPYFSYTSQHTYGRALDLIFKNATAEEVRLYIKQNHRGLGITAIEEGVNWNHIDCRSLRETGIGFLAFNKPT